MSSVTSERWQRIETLFVAASELPTSERAAYVSAECGGDGEVRDEVMSLLASIEGANEALRGVVAAEAERMASEVTTALVGRRLGAWKVLEPIGVGGMGTVYLAERADAEYDRKVAIKVVQHALGGEHNAARFRDERQILAALDHPGIVKLLDGGTTDDGLPYLVMDHVAGVPITRFARDRELDVRGRLQMFRGVCAAVQYAHQQLVIHRDLKPSNILVDQDGAPKLLDFGIAKLVDPEADLEREARTRTGMALLTPEYASPEQVRGETVSAATDVYSLGALLYELLADAPPLRATGSALEMLRVICEVDPPRPSTVCPAERRKVIAGDLDNILLKALHKDAARRYPSVQSLDDDLARYLDGSPVLARDATWSYRAAKFVRRNGGKLALGTAAAVALGALSVVSLQQAHRADDQAQRAQRRFDEVRKLARSLVFELDDKIRDLKGATAVRELVVTRALEYLDGLAAEAGDDPGLARELALAYMKIGDIQGNSFEPNLGRPDQGRDSYHKASAILDRLAGDGRSDLELSKARVRQLYGEAFIEITAGAAEPAQAAIERAIAAANALPPASIDDVTVIRGYLALVQNRNLAGDVIGANAAADHLLARVDEWAARSTGPEITYWRSVGHAARAMVRARSAEADESAAESHLALEEVSALARAYPLDARYQREEYTNRLRVAGSRGRYNIDTEIWSANIDDVAEAERQLQLAAEAAEKVVQRDRDDTRSRTELAATLGVLGAYIGDRSPADALPVLERALANWSKLAPEIRREHYVQQMEWFTHAERGLALARLGRREDALAEATAAVDIVHDGKAAGLEDEWIRAHYLAGQVHELAGDASGALGYLDPALAALEARITAHSRDVGDYIGLADTSAAIAALRPADACRLRTRIVAVWKAWPAKVTPLVEKQATDAAHRAEGCK